eukprot:COSAG02_NODE_7871_length_2810_cov_3.125046_1_plen_58_part_00
MCHFSYLVQGPSPSGVITGTERLYCSFFHDIYYICGQDSVIIAPYRAGVCLGSHEEV